MSNRFRALCKIVARAGGFYRVEASESEPSIYLYTIIGKDYDWGTGEVVGMSDLEFIDALMQCRNSPVVHLRVNSPGGDVFQMKAMQTAMAQFPGRIVAHVDSIAASAAAGLIMYADEIEMASNAFLMIHKAWTYAVGNADDMRVYAETMDQFDASLASDFARKTGINTEEILDMMGKTTYFDAETAKKKGFCDSVFEPKEKVLNKYDLSVYGFVPESLRVVSKDDTQEKPDASTYQCDWSQILRRQELIEKFSK